MDLDLSSLDTVLKTAKLLPLVFVFKVNVVLHLHILFPPPIFSFWLPWQLFTFHLILLSSVDFNL